VAPPPSRRRRPSPSRTPAPPWRRAPVDRLAVFFENRYHNHSDHRTAGWIALDSCFPGTGNPHLFSEQLGEGIWFFDEFLRKDAVRAAETIGVEHAEEFRVLDLS
jgi:hypothetical protein